MDRLKKIGIVLSLCLAVVFGSHAQFYIGSHQEFGKNRVQHSEFQWFTQNFSRFKIHYYQGEDQLVEYTAKTAHMYLNEIESFLDFNLNDKIDIIVYGTQTHFRQSNIGLNNEVDGNVGGRTQIIGNKIFVYYEGDHDKLNRQIKAGLAQVMMNKIMFGSNWKDVLKSNTLSEFPLWYVQGFVSYYSNGWNSEIESRVKDGYLTKKFYDFSGLEGEDAELAGHAMWNYIEENFGRDMVPTILQYTRMSHNINRGFRLAVGSTSQQLYVQLKNFYRSRYLDDITYQNELEGELLDVKYKKGRTYSQVKLSPDGDKIAYVTNHYGKYKIWIYSFSTEKLEKIYSAEPKLNRIMDKSYPVLEWHPTGDALIFANERKGELRYNIYTLQDKDLTTRSLGVDKILTMDFNQKGDKMVLSGSIMGITNIFMLDTKSFKLTKITDDIYDDLNPVFADNDASILFSSNRVSDTLPTKRKPPENWPQLEKLDLYKFELKNLNKHFKIVQRITNTPLISERNPTALSKNNYMYLSDQNGINNRFIAFQDSVISHIDTAIHYRYTIANRPNSNYVTSILEQSVNVKKKKIATLIYQNNRFKIIISDLDLKKETPKFQDAFYVRKLKNRLGIKSTQVGKPTPIPENSRKVPGIDTDNYEFEKDKKENNDFEKETLVIGQTNTDDKEEKPKSRFDVYEKPPSNLYKVNFAKDFVLTQVNNNFLNNIYQRYSGPGDVYINPGINALMKIGFSDVFEDYKIIGGARIPFNFRSSEFLGSIELLRKRLDHRIVVSRQTNIQENTITPLKWYTYEGRYRISYPINEVMSVRATMNYRNDRKVYLSVNQPTLERPNDIYHQTGVNFEYVFDNARYLDLNLWSGFKFKVFAEYLQNFVDGDTPSTFNFGMDGRYYYKIHKNLIWVNRIAWGTSVGDQKLLYYLGAVDNWVLRPNNSFNNEITVDPEQNYAYQTIGTPMRGFTQNIRNGNSFFVFNSEIRFPIFSFFSKNPIKSDFLRHFQIVAFGDMGTAWTGPHPWHEDNYFNTQVINDKPVTIKLQNARNPIVGGFGFGLRTRIMGYFIRFDLAWGIEDGKVGRATPYLSLSLDI